MARAGDSPVALEASGDVPFGDPEEDRSDGLSWLPSSLGDTSNGNSTSPLGLSLSIGTQSWVPCLIKP